MLKSCTAARKRTISAHAMQTGGEKREKSGAIWWLNLAFARKYIAAHDACIYVLISGRFQEIIYALNNVNNSVLLFMLRCKMIQKKNSKQPKENSIDVSRKKREREEKRKRETAKQSTWIRFKKKKSKFIKE